MTKPGITRISPPSAILLILLPVFLRALTPIFLKTAALEMQGQFTLKLVLLNVFYYLALVLFVLRAVTWQLALKRFPLSFAYPFNSLALGLILITASVFFDEQIEWFHVLGMAIMLVGLILFIRSSPDSAA